MVKDVLLQNLLQCILHYAIVQFLDDLQSLLNNLPVLRSFDGVNVGKELKKRLQVGLVDDIKHLDRCAYLQSFKREYSICVELFLSVSANIFAALPCNEGMSY